MTLGLFNASYGLSSANFRVRILEVGTNTPAVIMDKSGTVLNSTGDTVIDAYGNLSVYLDMSKTWGVHINQYTLGQVDHSVATFVQRSALQLASSPTLIDKEIGPGAIFYDPNHPETNYRISAAGTSFVVTTGGGGGGGTNGLNNATIFLYQRATSAPIGPNLPVTYTFATGTSTGLSNGWVPSIPAGTDPVWVTAATASNTQPTDVVAPNEWTDPVIFSQNGINSATIYIFQRTASATPPTLPDIPISYTFSTGVATGLDNGWTQTMPTTGGSYRWASTATALATGGIPADTVNPSEWATPSLLAQDGAAGANGLNNAVVWAYQRSASGAPTLPSATVTYAFSNGAISGLNNGWVSAPPTGTDPLYVTVASATAAGTTDTIAPNEWATPVLLVQNGVNGSNGTAGLNSATVFLYKVTTTSSPPALPSAIVTYTFGTATATGMDNGWTQTLPTSGGSYRWLTTASALGTGTTDVITAGEWATASLFSADGSTGATGTAGATGAAGPTGPAGTAGLNNSVVFIYQRSATGAPTLPSATITYTFATGGITGLTNGWTAAIPAGTDPVYIAAATASSSGPISNITSAQWATPVVMSQNGLAGLNAATIYLFQCTTTSTPPPVPSGTVTYTFATGIATGLTNSWVQSLPTTGGPFRWITTATASANTATDTVATGEWATPAILAQDGLAGLNNAIVYIYQRSPSGAPTLPSLTTTYTFATGGLTGLNNGWSATFPAGTDPVYVSSATASSSGTTGTIANTQWATAVVLSQNGVAGLNSATVYLFQRTATATAPALPSATITYTFLTGVATGITNGWTQSLPSTGGAYRWMTIATASNTTATDPIANTEWAAAQILAQDGTNGTNGTNGSNGATGQRGSTSFNVLLGGSTATWSDSLATTTASYMGGPVFQDQVTQYNNSVGFTQTKYWNNTSWVLITQVIDGGLLVTGSVTTPALAAGSVVANTLAANSVTSSKLLVIGQGRALNADPACMDLSAWTPVAGTMTLASNVGAPSGTSALALLAAGSGNHAWSQRFPIVGGRTYKVSVQVNGTSSSGTLYIRMGCVDASNSLLNSIITTISPGTGFLEGLVSPTTWTQYVGKITAATLARTAYLEIYTNWPSGSGTTYVTDFRCEEQIDASIVVDGSITATQISATAGITANQINARGLSILDASGNVILSAGTPLANQIVAGSGNLYQNGDFALSASNTPTGFQVYNNDSIPCSVTVYSGIGAVGGASMWRLSFTGNGINFGVGFFLTGGWAGWHPNTDYVWSFYAKTGSGTHTLGMLLATAWNHGPSTLTWLQNPGLTTSWQRYVVQLNFGSATIDANGFITTAGLINTGDSLDFSCVQIEAGTSASGFAPLMYIDTSGVTRGNPSGSAAVNVANSNIAISGGVISGIGTGSGTAVANSNVTISSNGTLSGAGGGQVTINGLGFVGALNASADITLVARNNCVTSGNSISKSGGTNAWDSDCYSPNGYQGGAYASAVIPNVTSFNLMFGLNSDPTTDQSYSSLDYAWYVQVGSTYSIYESGSNPVSGLTATAGDVLSITYDGVYVKYFINATVIRTLAVAANQTLYFDSSFYSPGAYITGVRFGPMSNMGPINTAAANAQTTANAAATAAADRISASSASILSATVSLNAVTGAGFRTGNLTWDSAGNRTGGSGVAMTPGGIIGTNSSGVSTFTLDASTGNAYFAGTLKAGTATGSQASGSIAATAANASSTTMINTGGLTILTYVASGNDVLIYYDINAVIMCNTNTPCRMRFLPLIAGGIYSPVGHIPEYEFTLTNSNPMKLATSTGATAYNWGATQYFPVTLYIPGASFGTGSKTIGFYIECTFFNSGGSGNLISGSSIYTEGQATVREFKA